MRLPQTFSHHNLPHESRNPPSYTIFIHQILRSSPLRACPRLSRELVYRDLKLTRPAPRPTFDSSPPPPTSRCLPSRSPFPGNGYVTRTSRSLATYILPCTSLRCPRAISTLSPPADLPSARVISPQDFHSYCHPHHQQPPRHNVSPSRKIHPLAKKIRLEWPSEPNEAPVGEQQRPAQQQGQTPLAPSSTRHNHRSTTTKQPQSTPSKTAPPAATTTNLFPCHICHRKPTKKTELDSYADCEGCGERTCYVCIRECLGQGRRGASRPTKNVNEGEKSGLEDRSFCMEDAPVAKDGDETQEDRTKRGGGPMTWGEGGGRGHRGRICSLCCVEEGPEGDAVCLGCLGS